MTGRARQVLTALLLTALVTLGWSPAATGASAEIGVSISDVDSTGTDLTGVLTLRSPSVVQVDDGSVRASVDGSDRPVEVSSAKGQPRTAMLVIDTSGSMGAEGMAIVRDSVRTYLAEAPADVRVGVTTFANTAGVDLAPTTDRAKVQRVVDGLAARGDTSLYAALTEAAGALGGAGDRSIVLLSDGADTISTARTTDRAAAVRAIRSRSLRVDVVRFKTEDPDTANDLGRFARAGGGVVAPADDAAAVQRAFASSARSLRSQARFSVTTEQELTGSHVLRLEGTASGTPFVVEQTIDLGGAPTTPVAQSTALDDEGEQTLAAAPAIGIGGSIWPWLGALALCGAIFLFTFGLFTPSVQTRRERRVQSIVGYATPQQMMAAAAAAPAQVTPMTQRLVAIGEERMRGRKSTPRTMQLIARADLPLRAGEWYVLCILAAVFGVLLGAIVLPGPALLGAILGLVLGIALPPLVLRFLAARRAKKFEEVLPQALLVVATTLKSGFGLPQAIAAVAQDAAAPVDKEFSRALAETRIGTDMADALERMAERMGSDAMHMAVLAIRIQREVGGNLAETLETTAHTLQERETLRRQIAALSAEGRLSAQILIALPIGLFFYMLAVNYDYLSLLWTTPLGIVMLFGAIVALIIGIFWMRRVVKIEV